MLIESDRYAIRVIGLGKQYTIGEYQGRYKSLRDTLQQRVIKPFQKIKTAFQPKKSDQAKETILWALKDVSFDIQHGEIVGIIGRNGAGKSTLLKILARITEPTEGEIHLRGRVGSLLEVGTGFHPELTGRENIFLNGAILGMSRNEIQSKFDEIVSFAEIDKFIDTPAKHYSSGMYMRLAFSVAAHLEPEILLVDEVLAVGDAAFQKKCLGKMGEVANQGRTVLFVSHNMTAIQNLCKKSLLLDHGKVAVFDETPTVIRNYNQSNESNLNLHLKNRMDRTGSGEVKCTKVLFLNDAMKEVSNLISGQLCYIGIEFESLDAFKDITAGIGIDNLEGNRLVTFYGGFTNQVFEISRGMGRLLCRVDSLTLRPDLYHLTILLGSQYKVYDHISQAATLEITESDFYKTGRLPDKSHGPLLIPHEWIIS